MSQVIAGGRWIVKKKPVEVEAMLFNGENAIEVREWMGPEKPWVVTGIDADHVDTLAIQTLEGVMTARAGDWIIRGVKGEFYPCKPDIFAETYEMVALVVDSALEISNGIEDNPPRIPPGHMMDMWP